VRKARGLVLGSEVKRSRPLSKSFSEEDETDDGESSYTNDGGLDCRNVEKKEEDYSLPNETSKPLAIPHSSWK